MVFQGGFMVFHGFWLVSMVFQGGFMVFWFLIGFHGFGLVKQKVTLCHYSRERKTYPFFAGRGGAGRGAHPWSGYSFVVFLTNKTMEINQKP